MSTMLHPEGPEEPRTYWMRRGISVGVVVLLVLVVALIWPRGGESQTASPQPPTGQPVSAPSSPSVGSDSVSAGKASTPSSAPTPSEPSPTKPKPTKPKASESKASESKAAKAASGPQACSPKDLSVSVSGPGTARVSKAVEFDVSVINSGKQDCEVDVNQKNFELRVYSGSDKIFSTDHCRQWAPVEAGMLAPGDKLEWNTSWGGTRTASKCKTTKQLLKPGTYVATAKLDKAKPAQHVMRLK